MHLTDPAVFHPASSLLGWLVRRWSADARQAESRYIVAAALVLGGAALAGQWAWVLWGAEGTAALTYFVAQVIGGSLVAAFCLLGWRPAIHFHSDGEKLEVRRGAETLVLPYGVVEAVERITADAYHRHWKRYATTRAFVNRLPNEVLLLTTGHGPIVLGLPADRLDRLEAHLTGNVKQEAPSHLVRAG